jgi:ribosomal protein S18 acetylase RimI-like enzyme
MNTAVDVTVRPAVRADARAMARLHATRIDEGFLSSLGEGFLTRLYRRVVATADACGYVAVDERGDVVGFIACTGNVRKLYGSFLVRDGVVAGALAAPRLLRSWRRVLETLRYPATTTDLPDAEVLSVAVARAAGGRGVGRSLVATAVDDLARRGVAAVKVVTGADNGTARAMYEACGFAVAERREVHDGVTSVVLVRDANAIDLTATTGATADIDLTSDEVSSDGVAGDEVRA